MAKIILLCKKDRKTDSSFIQDIRTLFRRLCPDNISPRQPLVIQEEGIAIGIFNPSPDLPVQNNSVCMGRLFPSRTDWWKPRAEIPDGTFALFRTDKDTVEVASDMLGTRTVWYVQTKDLFAASTSQRAIVFFLEEYRPNIDVYAWMLSSGTLGPGLSWDSRIKCLKGNSRLVLDRSSWKLALYEKKVLFNPVDATAKEHENRVKDALQDVFDSIDIDLRRWILTLSGGIDSRAILLFLKDRKNVKCITWGLRSSLKDSKSDAYIARSVAEHFGLAHEFLETDTSDEPFVSILGRFLTAGEGRIDNIAGYMDGFRIWKHLFESGNDGILRGDVAFGNRPVSMPRDVYKNVGLDILSDFDNLAPVRDVINATNQRRPSWLEKSDSENLEKWRDRLNAEFETPVVFAALNDLKLSYVETISPFLSRRIADQVRQLPDSLRTDKFLFKKIVKSLNPGIPFAQHRAVALTSDCLRSQSAVEFIMDELNSYRTRSLFPEMLVQFMRQNTKTSQIAASTRAKSSPLLDLLRQMVPKRIRRWRKTRVLKRNLDINTLAFRACLIGRMTGILSEDAKTRS
jgi:hypothetical protein